MFKKLVYSLSVLTVLLSSCEKDLGNLGMGIMPSEDILEVRLDSLSNFNFKYIPDNTNDTIRSSENTFSLILGSYIDPVFGKVRAEIYAPFYFDNPVLDTSKYQFEIVEAILKMSYNCTDNDTSFLIGKNLDQKVLVYQMNDSLSIDDYNTQNFKPSSETFLSSYTLKIDPTVLTDGNSYRTISFSLPKSFIDSIDNYIRKVDTTDTLDVYSIDLGQDDVNKVFSKKFYGLHLKTGFDDASIIRYREISIDVKIKVWDSENNIDTLTQAMTTSSNMDLEYYIYKPPLVHFELKPTTTITDNIGKSNQKKVYIQPMKGYKAAFEFPDINRWLDSSKTAINIAKFTIPIEKSKDYIAIPNLHLNIYEKGKLYPIFNKSSQTIYNNDYYVFDLRDFMNYFMKNAKQANEYHYEIVPPNNNLYVYRSILLTENAKLHLTYTKYK